jgi:hypothetical protein
LGATHFLTRTLDKVRTEMSLHVLAYNHSDLKIRSDLDDLPIGVRDRGEISQHAIIRSIDAALVPAAECVEPDIGEQRIVLEKVGRFAMVAERD